MKKILLKLIIFIFIATHSFAETYVCKMSVERYGQKGFKSKFYQRQNNTFVNQLNWKFAIVNETSKYLKLINLTDFDSIFAVLIDKKTNEFFETYASLEDARLDKLTTRPSYGTCEVVR